MPMDGHGRTERDMDRMRLRGESRDGTRLIGYESERGFGYEMEYENDKGERIMYEEITSLDESAILHGAITEDVTEIEASLDIYGDYDEDAEEVV